MTCIVDSAGTQRWRNKQGQRHRTDGLPAVIYASGRQEWWANGQRHRTDGLPAVIHPNGHRTWWVNGQLYRTDVPAVIDAGGSQEWYRNGRLHRIDGPAVILSDGSEYWYINHQDITNEVKAWMETQDVVWPWDSSTQTLFILTFGVCVRG